MSQQNLEDFTSIQVNRFQILYNLINTKKSLGQTNLFLDTCSYCIARCILLDIISYQKIKKFNNNKIQAFCDKYRETRNEQAHFYEVSKQATTDLLLIELEEILKEIISEQQKANIILPTDLTISKLLSETFKKLSSGTED